MKVEKKPPEPAPPVYNILGLTENEAIRLMDVLGMFSCNFNYSKGNAHWHSSLFSQLSSLIDRPWTARHRLYGGFAKTKSDRYEIQHLKCQEGYDGD